MRSLPFVVIAASMLALLCIGSPPARACIGDQLDSIHFNSGGLDWGTPPRRGIMRWSGEVTDRPATDEMMGGYTDFAELHEDIDEKSIVAREQHLNAIAALQWRGRWREAQRLYEQMGAASGWTGEMRDRTEICAHLAAQNKPLAP
ncbi:MAG TPA: hypothetical protein VKU00_25560, partial [Chthonomonadaceae bacterium]|nr:hypothetical protein [Chthonomonadaceae bacterium]